VSTVTLIIGPRSYQVACAPGEEAAVEKLGAIVAEKYAALGKARGALEAQNILFAALFLADELAEAREQAARAGHAEERRDGTREALEAELETLRRAEARARDEAKGLKAELAAMREAARHQHDLFGPPENAGADRIADALEGLAERLERAAGTLAPPDADRLEAGPAPA
jgi:cell division protein ZapA